MQRNPHRAPTHKNHVQSNAKYRADFQTHCCRFSQAESVTVPTCQIGCEEDRCAHVLADPASWLVCCPGHSMSGTFVLWVHPCHPVTEVEFPRLSIILYVASVPLSLPPSSYDQDLSPSTRNPVRFVVAKKCPPLPLASVKLCTKALLIWL